MKKFLIFLLYLFVFNAQEVSAEYYDDSNGDSWDSAYIINTSADLLLMRERLARGQEDDGKYYKLGADIDISEASMDILKSDDGDEVLDVNFRGHLDGQGHTLILSDTLFYRMGATRDTISIQNLNIQAL